MNELQEFLALIGRLVKWIFTWTLNVLSICAFLLSLIALWRAIWIIKNMLCSDEFTWNDFRIKSVVHLSLLFVDIFAFLLGFASLAFPTRIPHFFIIFYQTLNESFSSSTYRGDQYLITWQLRTRLASSFGYGIVDTMCLVLGLSSTLIPTRTVAFIRCCVHYKTDFFADDYIELRVCWINNFGLALCDLIVLPHFIASIPMFTRTYHLITGFTSTYHDTQPQYAFNEVLSYKTDYRWIAIRCFYAGIADFISLSFAILSLISPTRWISVFRTIFHNWTDYVQDDYTMSIRWSLIVNFACAVLDYIAFIHLLCLPLMFTRYYHLMMRNYPRNEYYHFDNGGCMQANLKYQRNVRYWILRNFYHGILDIVALCIGALSLIFMVRTVCFFKLFRRFSTDYKADDYAQFRYAMVINVLLSFIDLVFAILAVLVLLSLIRAVPLISDIKQHRYAEEYLVLDNDYKLRYNYQWRCDILKHFAFIFIDILFVPLLICCLLSVYQGIEIIHLFQDTTQWNEARMMTIRKQILINFVLLLLDIVCVLPLLLVVLCTVYRVCFVGQRMRHSWQVYHHNRAIRIRNGDSMASNLVNDAETPTVDAAITPMRICSTSAVAIMDDDDRRTARRRTPQTVRIDILYNVLLILFVDIPFMLVAVIVIMLTVYRIPKCMALIRESEVKIMNVSAFDGDHNVYRIILQCRWHIFEHFVGVLFDIPCLVLCAVLMITLWRSLTLYRILRKEVQSYNAFRSAAVVQTVYLIRDILFVPPAVVIVVTLWRLPILILHLMSKYRTARVKEDETIHFKLKQCRLELPTNGNRKPMIHILADKDPEFTLNDDLDASCRLFVMGSLLWESITEKFGAFIAIRAQSQTPYELKHGDTAGFDYQLCRERQREIEITFTLQTPFIFPREKLEEINRGGIPFVLQLEHDTKGILFAVRVTIDDLIRCAQDTGDGIVNIATDTRMKEIRDITGKDDGVFVDQFWSVVCFEFMYWIIDVVHLAIFIVMLCIAPWRWIQCVQLLFESTDAWYVRQHARVMGMLCHSNNIYYKLMDLLFDPMLNDLVKEKFIYSENQCTGKPHIDTEAYFETLCHELEHHWPQYVHEFATRDAEDVYGEYSMAVDMNLSNYDSVVYRTDHILREMEPIPKSKYLIQNHFETQNILIYLKLMQCNASILMMEDKLKWESHSILIEQIHLKETHLKNRIKYFHDTMQQAHDNLALQSYRKKRAECCNKTSQFQYSLIRHSLSHAMTDIVGIMMLALIFCTVYRVIPLVRDTVHLFRYKAKYKALHNRNATAVGPSLRYGFTQIVQRNLNAFITEVVLVLKLMAWSLLILVTLVRIFDYISELCTGAIKRGKPSLTLPLAVDIAKNEASQIWKDISSVFYVLFAWSTYKYAVSALLLGAFLPSAAFLEMFALLFPCIPRKMRQIASIVIWFGLFITVLYSATADLHTTRDNESLKFTLFSCITLSIICGFFIALFCCIRCRNFSDYKENLFQRESRIISRMCPLCHLHRLSAQAVTIESSVKCVFCEQNVRSRSNDIEQNKPILGCSLCKRYWCEQCTLILQNKPEAEDEEEQKSEPPAPRAIHNNAALILWSYPRDEYIPLYIRFAWTNVIAIGAVLFDVVQLISVLFYMIYIDTQVNSNQDIVVHSTPLFHQLTDISTSVLLTQFSYETYMTVAIVTLILATFWVIVCSLPLVCEQLFSSWGVPNGYFTKSTLWIKTCWLYSRVLFVTLTINLIKLSQCVYDADRKQCIIVSAFSCGIHEEHHSYCRYNVMSVVSFGLLLFFWFTTSIVLVYKNAQICLQKSDHLDIRYPLAFIHGLQMFQSLYIVFGLSLVLTHARFALFGCLILSYVMLAWHLLYPCVSRYIISASITESDDIIFDFCSVAHWNTIQTALYLIIAYVATMLCVFPNANTTYIAYGSGVILLCALVISFIIYKISYKQRLKTLHDTELKYMIQSLTDLYEETSHNGCVGNWYEWIGRNKFEMFTQNARSAPNDLAYLLIEFERHILFERLEPRFLLNRQKWISQLLSFDKFEQFASCIHELEKAIKPPPYFALALNALCNESELFSAAPKDICFLIMQFVVDTRTVTQIANELLLNERNLPSFDTQFPHSIVQRISGLAMSSKGNLIQCFVDLLNDVRADRLYVE